MPLPWLLLRWCNITNPHFYTLVLPAPKNSHRIHWKYTSVTIRPWAANGVCALGDMVRLCLRGSENQSIEHVWVSFPLMSHWPNNFVVFIVMAPSLAHCINNSKYCYVYDVDLCPGQQATVVQRQIVAWMEWETVICLLSNGLNGCGKCQMKVMSMPYHFFIFFMLHWVFNVLFVSRCHHYHRSIVMAK